MSSSDATQTIMVAGGFIVAIAVLVMFVVSMMLDISRNNNKVKKCLERLLQSPQLNITSPVRNEPPDETDEDIPETLSLKNYDNELYDQVDIILTARDKKRTFQAKPSRPGNEMTIDIEESKIWDAWAKFCKIVTKHTGKNDIQGKEYHRVVSKYFDKFYISSLPSHLSEIEEID